MAYITSVTMSETIERYNYIRGIKFYLCRNPCLLMNKQMNRDIVISPSHISSYQQITTRVQVF